MRTPTRSRTLSETHAARPCIAPPSHTAPHQSRRRLVFVILCFSFQQAFCLLLSDRMQSTLYPLGRSFPLTSQPVTHGGTQIPGGLLIQKGLGHYNCSKASLIATITATIEAQHSLPRLYTIASKRQHFLSQRRPRLWSFGAWLYSAGHRNHHSSEPSHLLRDPILQI